MTLPEVLAILERCGPLSAGEIEQELLRRYDIAQLNTHALFLLRQRGLVHVVGRKDGLKGYRVQIWAAVPTHSARNGGS